MIPKVIYYKQKVYAGGGSPVCIQVVASSKAIRKTIFHLN
jgi:hypothetical protein